ncbi:MAG: hypothetical protein OER80_08420 [Gammaproteobacteria bacterium]|nr:hypothetical protein [Gammaproteobacteria bacterium]
MQHEGDKQTTPAVDCSTLPAATQRAVEIVRAYDQEVSELAIAILSSSSMTMRSRPGRQSG